MLIIIAIILLVNAAGVIFRIYELDPYITLIGFRFHLSLTIPLLFLVNKEYRKRAGYLMKHPGQFKWSPFVVIILSAAALYAALYFTDLVKLSDPDYYYELGLSSIIDLPVYLIWNLPHILIFTLFISAVTADKKAGYLLAFLIFILLFTYRLIPLDKEKFDLTAALQLGSASILFSLFIYYIRNVYLSSSLSFLTIWLFLLLSGSNSEQMVSIFLGTYYSSWEGFLVPGKEWKDYIFFFYFGVQMILILAYILINAYNNKAVKNTAS